MFTVCWGREVFLSTHCGVNLNLSSTSFAKAIGSVMWMSVNGLCCYLRGTAVRWEMTHCHTHHCNCRLGNGAKQQTGGLISTELWVFNLNGQGERHRRKKGHFKMQGKKQRISSGSAIKRETGRKIKKDREREREGGRASLSDWLTGWQWALSADSDGVSCPFRSSMDPEGNTEFCCWSRFAFSHLSIVKASSESGQAVPSFTNDKWIINQ